MTITRTYKWFRHATPDPTVSPVEITGETSPFYTTTASDDGLYINCLETATNSKGAASQRTNVFGPIVAPGATFTPEAGRIAPIMTLYGGRAPKTLDQYLQEDDYIVRDAETNAHVAMMATMLAANPQTVAVKSGRWSDPATWSNGVPAAGYTAIIQHFTVTYDVESDVQLKYVFVDHGSLIWDGTKDTKMVVDTIHPCCGAYLEIGNEQNPIPFSTTNGKPRARIVFKGEAPGSSMFLGLMAVCKVSIRGAQKIHKFDIEDAAAGATSIAAKAGVDLSTLRPGDKILLLSRDGNTFSTDTDATYKGPKNFYYSTHRSLAPSYNEDGTHPIGFKNSHDEVATVTSISGQTINLEAPLTYSHVARTSPRAFKDGTFAKINASVCTLSRSIRFESGGDVTDLQQRAHIMFMYADQVDVRWAEAYNMARTDVDKSLTAYNDKWITTQPSNGGVSLRNPNNVRGRYAWHMHGNGRVLGRYMAVFEGLTAWAPTSGPPIPGWAITHHNSSLAVEKCTVYNVRGAGIVSETGNERGQWVDNTVAWARGDGFDAVMAGTCQAVENMNGAAGIGYENQARQILQLNNEAVSCHYGWHFQVQEILGFGMRREPDHRSLRLWNPMTGGGMRRGDWWQEAHYGIHQAQIPRLDGLVAVDIDKAVFVAMHRGSQRNDMTPGIFQDWKCYGCGQITSMESYTWHYFFKRVAAWGAIDYFDKLYNNGSGPAPYAFSARSKTGPFHIADCAIDHYTAAVSFNGGVNGTDVGQPTWYDPTGNQWARAVDLNTDGTCNLPAVNSTGVTYAAPTFTLDTTSTFQAPGDSRTEFGANLVMDWNMGRGFRDYQSGSQIIVRGKITDSIGDRPFPCYQPGDDVPEFYANNLCTPLELVERNGCFNDSGTWKSRLWFTEGDRLTHDHFVFSVDVVLKNYPSDVLAANTVTPDNPYSFPLLPESINKPFPATSPATKTTPPWIMGRAVVGQKVTINPGVWSGKPNDVDYYEYSIRRGATEVAQTRTYTFQPADAGQVMTFGVTAHNAGGHSTEATVSVTCQAVSGADVRSALGAPAVIGSWDANDGLRFERQDQSSPDYADGNVYGTAGSYEYFNPVAGVRVSSNRLAWEWAESGGAVVNTQYYGFAKSGIYQPTIWDGAPAVELIPRKVDNSLIHSVYSSMLQVVDRANLGAGFTWPNIHLWLVVQRPSADQPTVAGLSGTRVLAGATNGAMLPGLHFKDTTGDPSQGSLYVTRNGAAWQTIPLAKGERAVIYVGRDSRGNLVSKNNSALVVGGDGGAAPSGGYTVRLGDTDACAHAYVKAFALASIDGISSTQYAQIQNYLAQRFL